MLRGTFSFSFSRAISCLWMRLCCVTKSAPDSLSGGDWVLDYCPKQKIYTLTHTRASVLRDASEAESWRLLFRNCRESVCCLLWMRRSKVDFETCLFWWVSIGFLIDRTSNGLQKLVTLLFAYFGRLYLCLSVSLRESRGRNCFIFNFLLPQFSFHIAVIASCSSDSCYSIEPVNEVATRSFWLCLAIEFLFSCFKKIK